MSETFYIKKTAFDDNNFDLTQRETDSFIIGPGELNGPGGLAADSDLELYGFGAIKWGEGVNQNQYRMLESNACPEKVAGDFLVGTDNPSGFVPGTGSFVPNAGSPRNGAVPKDRYDLGLGNGITNPLIGQLWYNTDQQVLYNYELAGWTTVFREASQDITDHINDGTVHLRSGQDVFLDGLDIAGSPPALTSTDANQLVGITTVDGTIQDQLDLKIDSRGDVMTAGNLTLNSGVGLLTEGGSHRITNDDGGGDFNIRIGHQYSGSPASELYTATNSGAIHLLGSTDSAAPTFTVKLGNTNTTIIGNPVAYNGIFTFENAGNISVSATAPTATNHLARKDYIDNNFVADAGGIMNTNASIAFSGTGNITGIPLTPASNSHAASKWYVDNYFSTYHSRFEYGSAGTFYLTVPTYVDVVYISMVGGGQGGQGGGDGGSSAPGAQAGAGGYSYVSSNVEQLVCQGGTSIQDAGGGTTATYNTFNTGWAYINNSPRPKWLGTLASSNLGESAVGITGNPARGGHGGPTPFGYGGTSYANFGTGQAGYRGGGGGGGGGQDNLGGGGGASGGFVLNYPLRVSGGTTLTIRVGSGSAGTVAASPRGTGGNGGNGYVMITY